MGVSMEALPADSDARLFRLQDDSALITEQMSALAMQNKALEEQDKLDNNRPHGSQSDQSSALKKRAELERQLHDLALLREQVMKLKEELSIARRLELIKQGLYQSVRRGGNGLAPTGAAPAGN